MADGSTSGQEMVGHPSCAFQNNNTDHEEAEPRLCSRCPRSNPNKLAAGEGKWCASCRNKNKEYAKAKKKRVRDALEPGEALCTRCTKAVPMGTIKSEKNGSVCEKCCTLQRVEYHASKKRGDHAYFFDRSEHEGTRRR